MANYKQCDNELFVLRLCVLFQQLDRSDDKIMEASCDLTITNATLVIFILILIHADCRWNHHAAVLDQSDWSLEYQTLMESTQRDKQ